jgi:hypothetical protein
VSGLRTTLEGLLPLRDPAGVLSVYVDCEADRGRRARPREGEIAARAGLDAVAERTRAEGPPELARLLRQRIGGLGARLADAADPARAGGGRALFVTLSDGAVREVSSRHSMGDEVALASSACLMPLMLAAADEEAAGVVVASGEGLRAVDVSGGQAEDVLREEFAIPTEDWRPLVGPVAANPARGSESESQRDLFARRLEEHRRRRVAEIAPAIWRRASRRGWRRVLAAGPPELVEALRASRPQDGPDLVVDDRLLRGTLSAEEVRRAAEEPLAAARIAEGRALAERVRDAALASSGRAAVGVDDVLTALEAGRVSHLLMDPRRRHAGVVTSDGRLAAAGERPPGAGVTAPEPHLMERMLERALAAGARATALEGAAAEPLAPHGGVAAELRW